jgi:hypothetical protein
MYKITNTDSIIRVSDGAFIPADPANFDYASYLAWLAAGNTPEPADVPTLDEIKAAKWEAIKTERDRRVQLGGYKVGQHWYQSDTFSRTQQIGLVILGSNIPAGLQWKTYEDGFVTMTQTLANQIFAAAAAQDAANFSAAITHKTAMEASQDPVNYDFSQGWPESYQP